MSLLVYTSSVFVLQRRAEGSTVGAGQRVRRLQEKCSAQVVSEEDRGLPGNELMTKTLLEVAASPSFASRGPKRTACCCGDADVSNSKLEF